MEGGAGSGHESSSLTYYRWMPGFVWVPGGSCQCPCGYIRYVKSTYIHLGQAGTVAGRDVGTCAEQIMSLIGVDSVPSDQHLVLQGRQQRIPTLSTCPMNCWVGQLPHWRSAPLGYQVDYSVIFRCVQAASLRQQVTFTS
jgi:hypothetical protein